jgi:hypothetical protein
MISNPMEMRALSQDLANSTWTLGAIGALLESGLVEHLRELRSADDLAARCPGLSKGRIGDASAMFAPALKMNLAAGLGDLAERLDRPGGRFLDVGVGVASLSIAMCRLWPPAASGATNARGPSSRSSVRSGAVPSLPSPTPSLC